MKKVVLMALLIVHVIGFSQNKLEIVRDSFPIYKNIVYMDGRASKQIYSSVKEWTAINFKSAKNVVQMDDSDNGKLIIKANSDFSYRREIQLSDHLATVVMSYVVNYNIIFDIKDNKFRFTIEITDVVDNRDGISMFKSIVAGVDSHNKKILDGVADIKSALSKSIINIKDQKQDDW